jgi:hypothetical protein
MKTPTQKRALTVEIKKMTEYIEDLELMQNVQKKTFPCFWYLGELLGSREIAAAKAELQSLINERRN